MGNSPVADEAEKESVRLVESKDRKQPIQSLAKELLIKLAEKHLDFDVLIDTCEHDNDEIRLREYMRLYCHHGFTSHLFQYYLARGKRRKLLCLPTEVSQDLAQFLKEKHQSSILWAHALAMREYSTAACALTDLADQEKRSLGKKKTLLSLAKLAALADKPENHQQLIQQTNQKLYVANMQIAQSLQPARANNFRALSEDPQHKGRRLGFSEEAGSLSSQSTYEHSKYEEIYKQRIKLEGGQLLTPMTPQEIIEAFLDPLNDPREEAVSNNTRRIILALDVFHHSNMLRTKNDNDDLLHSIFRRVLFATDWVSLGQDWESGQLSDLQFEDKIAQTFFYSVACSRVCQPLPILDLFSATAAAYINEHKIHGKILDRVFCTVRAMIEHNNYATVMETEAYSY